MRPTEPPSSPRQQIREPAPTVPRRRWLPLLLLLATTATMTLAGSLYRVAGDLGDDLTLENLLGAYRGHPDQFLRGLPFAGWLLLVLGAHEMGHYLACRRYGVPATLPYFIPGPWPFGTFGAVIRIRGVIPNRRVLFDIAAAGPIAGWLVALPLLVVGIVQGRPYDGPPEAPGLFIIGSPLLQSWVLEPLLGVGGPRWVGSTYLPGWFGLLVTSMNLFPVGQLDGGHVAYAVSRRVHRWTTRATLVGLALLIATVATTLYRPSLYTVWFFILLWLRDRHPPVWDESLAIGAGRRLVAWALLAMFLLSFIPVPGIEPRFALP